LELRGSRRSRRAGRYQTHFSDDVRQLPRHRLDVLVRHRAEDEIGLQPRLREKSPEASGPVRIVASVQENRMPAQRETLEPPRPTDRSYARRYRGFADRPRYGKELCRTYGRGRVRRLMPTQEWRHQFVGSLRCLEPKASPLERGFIDLELNLRLHLVKEGARVTRRIPKRAESPFEAALHEGRLAATKDSCLFAGDRLDRRAELLGVVEGDRGDDGELGRGDVGRVEATAQSDFENSEVEPLLGEEKKGGRRHDLEVRRGDLRGAIRAAKDARERFIELRLRDVFFLQPDPLAPADHVRLGVGTRPPARPGGNRGESGGPGAPPMAPPS